MKASVLGALGATVMLVAASAGAQEVADAGAPVAQPNLSSLATPVDVAAAGEAASGNRSSENGAKVEVDGASIPLEERELRLENTSLRGLYRRGPAHVPK